MDVRLPDGTVLRGVPDGTTKADIVAKLQANGREVPAEWLALGGPGPFKPASVEAGQGLMAVPRQVGLAARYGMEGLGQLAEIGTEPIRAGLEALGAPKMQPTGRAATVLADTIGLPSPQTADERVIGDATRLMAGSAGIAGTARGVAGAALGATKKVAATLAAAPAQQAIAGGAAGLAGGSVREAGGDDATQFGAALAAGLAAPLMATAGKSVVDAAGRAAQRSFNPQKVEIVLRTELAKQGISWDDLGARVKQQLREDARKAVYSGQPMNADALARLVDYRRIGATPLVGDLTQDPVLLTQQRNLSKQLANSSMRVMGGDLPSIQNENAGKVLRTLDNAATSPLDETATGQGIINSVRTTDAKQEAATSALYGAARNEAGRSLPLDGATFTQRANDLLKQNLSPKLGGEIDTLLNDIATGKTPLTVEYAEQIKTMLARKQRGAADGDIRHAYGLVRQALDETQLQGAGTSLPGVAGQEAIDAFNAARKSARVGFAWKESAKFVEDALGGAAPDKFVQRHVIGAPAQELAKLQAQIANNPQLLDATRRQLVDYIMRRGSADPALTTFSGAGLEKGLKAVGDRKLALFFSPDEIADMKAAVNVARLSQSQPIGSAVNNSNSGALVLGRIGDLIGKTTGVPLLGPMVSQPLQSLTLGAQTIPLRNLSAGLTNRPPPQPRNTLVPLSALLAAPSAQGREDNDRR